MFAAFLLKLLAYSLVVRDCVTCVGMSTTRNIYGGCGAPLAWGSGCGLSIRPREVNGVADVRSYPSHSWYSAAECSLAKGSQKYGNAEIMDRPYEYPSEEDMTCQPCDNGEILDPFIHKDWPSIERLLSDADIANMEMRDWYGAGLFGFCVPCNK